MRIDHDDLARPPVNNDPIGAARIDQLEGDKAKARAPTRLLLNALRAIPELVWAALLLISAGLGPFAGTLALAFHTSGVLGRLFSEALENTPREAERALVDAGSGATAAFAYGALPMVLPAPLALELPAAQIAAAAKRFSDAFGSVGSLAFSLTSLVVMAGVASAPVSCAAISARSRNSS